MGTKPKYQQNIEAQAKMLDPARRELVLKEFESYKWNIRQIDNIESQYEAESDIDVRKKLLSQRHQLVNENTSLFSHMMRHLGTNDDSQSELDAFLEQG